MQHLQLDKGYINVLLVSNHVYYKYWLSHRLHSRHIHILYAISKLTSGNLGACTVTELRGFLTGITKRDCYIHIKLLADKNYISIPSRSVFSKKYITLTLEGQDLIKKIHRSIYNRIAYLNDKMKLKDAYVKPGTKRANTNAYYREYRKKRALLRISNTIQT